MRYDDIDPRDIDPETNRPYAGYSSPSLDTSLHDHEMAIDDDDSTDGLLREAAAHIRGVTGAQQGSDSAYLVERIERALGERL